MSISSALNTRDEFVVTVSELRSETLESRKCAQRRESIGESLLERFAIHYSRRPEREARPLRTNVLHHRWFSDCRKYDRKCFRTVSRHSGNPRFNRRCANILVSSVRYVTGWSVPSLYSIRIINYIARQGATTASAMGSIGKIKIKIEKSWLIFFVDV